MLKISELLFTFSWKEFYVFLFNETRTVWRDLFIFIFNQSPRPEIVSRGVFPISFI